jgi:uncharacterized protein YecE (DUF72 family)
MAKDREPSEIPEAEPEQLAEARALAQSAPVPARVGAILCGTAGWTDPTLLRAGTFYPPGTRTPADRLAWYASRLPMVEVDSTFYAIPSPSVSSLWLERTPASFVFDIKAHPVFTGHPIDRSRLPAALARALSNVAPERKRLYPKDLPEEARTELIRAFRAFVEPLRQANRLGCVMIQLPPWTTATRGAVRQLESLPAWLPDIRLAIEFRHPSWMQDSRRERLFDLLHAHGLAHVAVDEPDVPGGGVPTVMRSTRDDLAIVRFHGHNVAGWRTGATVQERFNYLYSPAQLAAWVEPVRRLADQSSQVHAVFNNCVRDYAVLGARDLAALLATEPAPPHDEVAPSTHSC